MQLVDCIRQNYTAVVLIAHGVDNWSSVFPIMENMRQCYFLLYSSLPVNTQFVERVARGKVLPEAPQHGLDFFNKETSVEDIERKRCQLPGKRKTTSLMQTLLKHHEDVQKLKQDNNAFTEKRRKLKSSLTNKKHQFKQKHIQEKTDMSSKSISKTNIPYFDITAA
eukprot:657737-Ditylum_brightwellii.AAC.1